jgi:hypothetical protein
MRVTLRFAIPMAIAVAGGACEQGFVETGFPAYGALLKGTVTSSTPVVPGTLTATSVVAVVQHSCATSDVPGAVATVQVADAGGPYRLTVITHGEVDTSQACVIAWALRTSTGKRDSVVAPPVILTFRSRGAMDSATVDFHLP